MSQFPASALLRWTLATGLICLAGCMSPGPADPFDDPIRGGKPISATGTAVRPSSRDDETALPPRDLGRSPAALASGGRSTDRPEEGGSIISLGAPRASESGKEVASAGFRSTASSESYEQLQQKLQERGVVWQQLKGGERGEWVFTCCIPTPGQPGVEKCYEGKAPGRHGLEAIRAVLADIDAQQKQGE
jgi:hypothetical protein